MKEPRETHRQRFNEMPVGAIHELRAALSSAPAPDAAMEVLKELVDAYRGSKSFPDKAGRAHGPAQAWGERVRLAWDRARTLIAANKERNMDRG